MIAPADLVGFWTAAGPKAWFRKDPVFDATLRERFEAAHMAASRGELDAWNASAEGAVALLVLLDQIPRNIWRDSPHAFATDPLALAHAARAVDAGLDRQVATALQIFFYLPFEHAEDGAAQDRALALFTAHAARIGGDDEYLRYARLHAEVIARFGRFPHRNPMLGRTTSAEEADFLAAGGFRG
ncbi:MAG TPA: DUF924 family protein [Caulobacteraceae bacterium]|jgi:uncharacterized protein (DUF924 family)|nr:DUF924 family protein [Caulobacteraceae bacterium]